ncbi:MAG: nucleoside hydrolase [Alphaproteobacteria bacterium]
MAPPTTTPRPIIIDCDPGQDDAIALLLALAAPEELEILGITTVAGNVPLPLTQRNARLICDLAGRSEIKVFAGATRPLVRELITAEAVHGRTGVDGLEIVEPTCPLQPGHGVDFIIETLMQAGDDTITLVPVGPLTNIAMALVKEPAIVPKINQIVLMGGAMREGGNTTPSAEFNILVDPHAADIVFRCGRPIVAFGLDVTHQVMTTHERLGRIGAIGNKVSNAAHAMLSFYDRHDEEKYGTDGGPLHDPCTIAYLLRPELFSAKPCNVTVEINSEVTIGHTAVDLWGVTDRPHNTAWITKADAEGFYDLLAERLAGFGA